MKQYDGYCAIGPLIAKRNNDCGYRGYHIGHRPAYHDHNYYDYE